MKDDLVSTLKPAGDPHPTGEPGVFAPPADVPASDVTPGKTRQADI